MAINRPNDRFFNRAFRLQASIPPAIEHLSFTSPDSGTESAAEPSSPEQAMIPQQAMMQDALSPHTSSPLPADADATERDGVCIATPRRAKFDIGVRSSKDGKSGAWWWTLPHPED